jgi:thiamine-phosphate pyrophosphorylase
LTSPAARGKARSVTAPCRLYLITPAELPDLEAFSRDLEAALSAGDVAALQIRLKGAPAAEVARAFDRLAPIARAHGVAVILNDDPWLARALGCDGVHLGQDDLPYADARRVMGSGAIVGVTCHASRHLAMEAADAGADYVAFGAFFPSETKEAAARADPEILSIWQETVETPCVAIGGITVETAADLACAGADFLAVSSGVWRRPGGPAAAVAAFEAEMAKGVRARGAAFSRD